MIKLLNKKRRGFTLIEVLFTAAILAFVLCGILLMYINLFLLSDISRQITLATNAAQAEMELLKDASRTSFDTFSNFNGTTFNINGFNAGDAIGLVQINDVAGYTDLKEIRVIVSFRQKGQRIIGEDQNLNGNPIPELGEDANNNGRLDSPIEIVTFVSKTK